MHQQRNAARVQLQADVAAMARHLGHVLRVDGPDALGLYWFEMGTQGDVKNVSTQTLRDLHDVLDRATREAAKR